MGIPHTFLTMFHANKSAVHQGSLSLLYSGSISSSPVFRYGRLVTPALFAPAHNNKRRWPPIENTSYPFFFFPGWITNGFNPAELLHILGWIVFYRVREVSDGMHYRKARRLPPAFTIWDYGMFCSIEGDETRCDRSLMRVISFSFSLSMPHVIYSRQT